MRELRRKGWSSGRHEGHLAAVCEGAAPFALRLSFSGLKNGSQMEVSHTNFCQSM